MDGMWWYTKMDKDLDETEDRTPPPGLSHSPLGNSVAVHGEYNHMELGVTGASPHTPVDDDNCRVSSPKIDQRLFTGNEEEVELYFNPKLQQKSLPGLNRIPSYSGRRAAPFGRIETRAAGDEKYLSDSGAKERRHDYGVVSGAMTKGRPSVKNERSSSGRSSESSSVESDSSEDYRRHSRRKEAPQKKRRFRQKRRRRGDSSTSFDHSSDSSSGSSNSSDSSSSDTDDDKDDDVRNTSKSDEKRKRSHRDVKEREDSKKHRKSKEDDTHSGSKRSAKEREKEKERERALKKEKEQREREKRDKEKRKREKEKREREKEKEKEKEREREKEKKEKKRLEKERVEVERIRRHKLEEEERRKKHEAELRRQEERMRQYDAEFERIESEAASFSIWPSDSPFPELPKGFSPALSLEMPEDVRSEAMSLPLTTDNEEMLATKMLHLDRISREALSSPNAVTFLDTYRKMACVYRCFNRRLRIGKLRKEVVNH